MATISQGLWAADEEIFSRASVRAKKTGGCLILPQDMEVRWAWQGVIVSLHQETDPIEICLQGFTLQNNKNIPK